MQLGLDGRQKRQIHHRHLSLAYSSHNDCGAATAAVPALQVQHREGAPEGPQEGTGLAGGAGSPLRTHLRAKGNAQEHRCLPLPASKRKLFPVPLVGGGGAQAPPPPVFATPESPPGPVLLVPRKTCLISFLCSTFDLVVKNRPAYSSSALFLLDLLIKTHTHTL